MMRGATGCERLLRGSPDGTLAEAVCEPVTMKPGPSALCADNHQAMTSATLRTTASWNITATAKVIPKNSASCPLVSGRAGLRADLPVFSPRRSASAVEGELDGDIMLSLGLERAFVPLARTTSDTGRFLSSAELTSVYGSSALCR